MAKNYVYYAKKAWLKLGDIAMLHRTCRYKELGDSIGLHYRQVGRALGYIQRYCQNNNLPPLQILVVNNTGKPGCGFVAASENEIPARTEEVFAFNWKSIENPFYLLKE